MALSALYAYDRDALLCDMAETYGVFDLRALPLQTVAVLAQGLRPDSRIMLRLAAEESKPARTAGFDSPEAFLAARAKILGGG